MKILTREEETSAIKEYRDPSTSSRRKQRLKEQILESNLRLVFGMAKSMWDKKDPELLADLIANGNVGLTQALDRFDPNYGTRFCTYAGHWVLMTMRGTFRGLIRVPNGKDSPTICGEEFVPQETYEDTVEDELDHLTRRVVSTIWLGFLSERERFIVESSYSLRDPSVKPASLRDMSRVLGLSSERVRQIRAGSLDKLRLWMSYHYPDEDLLLP